MIDSVAPVAVTGVIPEPFGSEATPPEREIAVEVLDVEGEIVAWTTPTTPFAMVVVFSPNRMQVIVPEPLQVMVLPAFVAEAPSVTVSDERMEVE